MYMSQGPWCTGNYVLESFISMVLGFNQRFVFSQKATVQLNAIRAKTRTATAKDVEVLHFFGGATDAVRISTIYIYIIHILHIHYHLTMHVLPCSFQTQPFSIIPAHTFGICYCFFYDYILGIILI